MDKYIERLLTCMINVKLSVMQLISILQHFALLRIWRAAH